jgi:hypothetical protein
MLGVPCVAVVAIHGELSTAALLAVAFTGVALASVGLVRRAGEAAPPVGRRGLPWLAWLAAAATWELLTLAADGLPTLSDLLDPVLAHPVPRAAATAAWLAGGAWLLACPGRGRRAP